LLITLLGTGFVGIYIRRSRREGIYIGVGIYLVGFSALALYCNFTSWTNMATLWPFFVGFLGLSLCLGHFLGKRSPASLLSGLLVLSLAVVLYLVFAVSLRLWWTAFILAGASFLVSDRLGKEG
jgi:hypothetical protein